MKLFRRRPSALHSARALAHQRNREIAHELEHEQRQTQRNEDTAAIIAAKLAQLNSKDYTVLGIEPSDSGRGSYEIRMGSNHAVYCQCKGWQFSKTGTCKHIERFKVKMRKKFGGDTD